MINGLLKKNLNIYKRKPRFYLALIHRMPFVNPKNDGTDRLDKIKREVNMELDLNRRQMKYRGRK